MDIREMEYTKLAAAEVQAALFQPRAEWNPPPTGAFEREVTVADGVVLPLRFFLQAEGEAAVNILLFHGKKDVATDLDEIAASFNRLGLNLVVAEYRGYGRAGGQPSVLNMIKDAHQQLAATRETLAQEGKTGYLAVMGRSLGSVPAIDLAVAAAEPPAGLIIESGVAQTIPFLLNLGVEPAACGITSEADGFCNVQKISLLEKPTYILHAQHDQIVPLGLAESLQAHCGAQSKEFQMVPGADHTTIIATVGDHYFKAIAAFCRKLGQKPRRKKSGVR